VKTTFACCRNLAAAVKHTFAHGRNSKIAVKMTFAHRRNNKIKMRMTFAHRRNYPELGVASRYVENKTKRPRLQNAKQVLCF